MDPTLNDNRAAPEPLAPLGQAYVLAFAGLPILLIYAVAQASLSLIVGPNNPNLKLVLEPNLLLLGLILHVQWRKVSHTFRAHGLARPAWVAGADCLSFIITFWALCALGEAFLQQAKLL
jgi:hypothetical protein